MVFVGNGGRQVCAHAGVCLCAGPPSSHAAPSCSKDSKRTQLIDIRAHSCGAQLSLTLLETVAEHYTDVHFLGVLAPARYSALKC